MVNLGDGQLYGHSRNEEKIAISGKVRIITGVTTEYIDAEFSNGFAIGKWEYYRNNKLNTYISYNNGYKEGEYAELATDGTPKITGSYLNGKKEGTWDTYGSEGNKKQTEIYKDGGLEKKITYYTNGNIDAERNYKNGKENGIVRQYTLDGTLKAEKNYINGKQVGKQMQYYTSNVADYIETSNYSVEGKKDGEFIQVYANSKNIKTKGQYVNGQKDGKWVYNNEKGKLLKEELYENGVQKNSKTF